jgi:large subunit ribosomal protein L29
VKDSFNDLAYPELLAKREELKKQFRDTRFNLVVGHIDNPVLVRTLRRKVARLNTLVHECDTGIRAATARQAAAPDTGKEEQ